MVLFYQVQQAAHERFLKFNYEKQKKENLS